MDNDLKKSVKAAYLEFEKEPMDAYYSSRLAGYFSRLRVKKIIQELGDIKGKKVLDVGCEAGYVSLKLLDKGAEVIAFDVCEPALNKFKEKLKRIGREDVKPFLAFAQSIPLKKESVDAVVCSEVIEHMPQLDRCIAEIASVTKKNGKVVVTFPNEGLRKLVYPVVKKFGINTDVEKDVTLFKYSKKEIIGKLRKHLKIVKSYSIPKLFPMTNIIVCEKT
jgi:2-polyprenyl-3-methyl-5-hydroxy-6-metoxy-1,4-benzoquinol methylase